MNRAIITQETASELAYEEAFNPVIGIAFLTGQALFILTFIILFQVLVLSFLRSAREKRKKKFIGIWQPIMEQCTWAQPVAESLPKIKKADIHTFLILWNRLHETTTGEYRQRLNRLLTGTGLIEPIIQMLDSTSRKKQLTAIVTLGHLSHSPAWEELYALAEDEDPHISLIAMRALFQCDKERAARSLMPVIARRADWPQAKVANILKEAGAESISEPLIGIIEKTDTKNLPRLMRYMEIVSSRLAIPVVRSVIIKSKDPEVIASCLKVLNDPLSIDIVRDFLSHESWFVRVQAATVLGRMGTEEDEPLLIPLLSDKEWWVRYRAAHAIAQLPSVGLEKLKAISSKLTDRYAIDIMKQVISENA